MKYNSHYVPRFILRNFGNKINVYDRTSGTVGCQEFIDDSYMSYGMYPEDVEVLLSERIEVEASEILSRLMKYDTVLTSRDELILRRFAFVSYLRSVRPEVISSEEERNDLLRHVLNTTDFYPAPSQSTDSTFLASAGRI